MPSSNPTRHVAKPNETTNAYWLEGEETTTEQSLAASTAMEDNAVLAWSSGELDLATSSSEKDEIYGLLKGTVASTDSDYASATKTRKIIEFPAANTYRLRMPVTTGTALSSMEGSDYDLTDAYGLDVGTTTKGHFKITKYISAELVEGYFNA